MAFPERAGILWGWARGQNVRGHPRHVIANSTTRGTSVGDNNPVAKWLARVCVEGLVCDEHVGLPALRNFVAILSSLDGFIQSGEVVPRQFLRNRLASIAHERSVKILPRMQAFDEGIHPGKTARHG
jgi:hypothetical protein